MDPDQSLPLPKKPNTRANNTKNVDDNINENSISNEISFVLIPEEWKVTFSRTHQQIKVGWTGIFYDKLTESGVKCPIKF